MQTRSWIAMFLCALLAACAGLPSVETRHALAPAGKLRVALLEANAVHLIGGAGQAESRGVSHDLGRALAAKLQVPFEPVVYPTIGGLLEAGKAGAWDVAFFGVSEERRKHFDFTANHLEVEYGYLVPGSSKMADARDIDRAGVRLAVVEKGSPDAFLTGALKHATLLRTPAIAGALEMVSAGKADAVGGLKPNMYAVAARLPGSRVLEGRPGAEGAALALPKGRAPDALAYASDFIETAKSDGMVQRAIERAGLRGVVVAPGR